MTRSTQRHRHISRNNSVSPRQRVLHVACQVFARRGFNGTHIRDVCNLAHVSVASLCYYFHSKEDLYAAVQAEARQRLSRTPASTLLDPDGNGLQHRLEALIESLFAKLTTDSAWIARLLARAVADDTTTSLGAVGEGFHADLRLLESIITGAVGPQADPRTLRLAALSVLGQCVFLCAAEPRLPRLLPKSRQHDFTRRQMAFHLANLLLWGLNGIARSPASHPRQTPQTPSSHYGMSQFKKWLRWVEKHHHETKHKQSSQTATDGQ